LLLPVPNPSRLNLMPVLPKVTWSVAVRVMAGPAAPVSAQAQGENNTVPANAVEVLRNSRRFSPEHF
jgi:hypothetical protein